MSIVACDILKVLLTTIQFNISYFVISLVIVYFSNEIKDMGLNFTHRNLSKHRSGYRKKKCETKYWHGCIT